MSNNKYLLEGKHTSPQVNKKAKQNERVEITNLETDIRRYLA
jgi:hypothetical protein